jgi:hypothetical protein
MKTLIQNHNLNENNLRSSDEHAAQKQDWKTPVLKVMPVERASKAVGGVPDGPFTS